MHGVLQSTCATGIALHAVNMHEGNICPFQTWEDSCEWFDGLENNDNNANQIRFRLDTLNLTTRTIVDQRIQNFWKLKL